MCRIGMKTNNDIKAIPWELILKILKDVAGEDEKNRLDAWVEADYRHRRLWNELRQAWDDICTLNTGFNPDTLRAWRKVVEKTKKQYRKPAHIIPMYWRTASAACILILIGVAIGIRVKTHETSPVTYTQYETQREKSLITLPDGTQVWLNAGTVLKFSNLYNEKERQVELRGEALFDVTHHQDVPFMVNTEDMQVKVHGTKFNVQAYDNQPETSVSLLEGSISFLADGCPVTRIEPGYTGVYNRQDKKLALNPSDTLVTVWANKELRIVDKSLEETVRLLESWYRVSIELAPELKSSHYFTLTVRHEAVDDLLTTMQKIAGFRFRTDEQKIVIY